MKWNKIRCKFFENHYKYNDKGQIKGRKGIILKPNKKDGISVFLSIRMNGLIYKHLFDIDKLINSDHYMDQVVNPPKVKAVVKHENTSVKFKKKQDLRVRSCSLENISSLNLT